MQVLIFIFKYKRELFHEKNSINSGFQTGN